jgi:hypothetical protein
LEGTSSQEDVSMDSSPQSISFRELRDIMRRMKYTRCAGACRCPKRLPSVLACVTQKAHNTSKQRRAAHRAWLGHRDSDCPKETQMMTGMGGNTACIGSGKAWQDSHRIAACVAFYDDMLRVSGHGWCPVTTS